MPKTTVPLTEVKPLLPQSKKTLFNKQDIFIPLMSKSAITKMSNCRAQ